MKSQTETWKEGSGGEEGRGELVTLDSLLSVCSQGEAEGWEVVEWRVRGESEQGVTYHIRSKWKGGNRRRIGLGNLMRQGGKHWQITRRSSGLVTLRYVNHFGQHFLVASEFWVVFQLYFLKSELAVVLKNTWDGIKRFRKNQNFSLLPLVSISARMIRAEDTFTHDRRSSISCFVFIRPF